MALLRSLEEPTENQPQLAGRRLNMVACSDIERALATGICACASATHSPPQLGCIPPTFRLATCAQTLRTAPIHPAAPPTCLTAPPCLTADVGSGSYCHVWRVDNWTHHARTRGGGQPVAVKVSSAWFKADKTDEERRRLQRTIEAHWCGRWGRNGSVGAALCAVLLPLSANQPPAPPLSLHPALLG